jgi:hypothetical protein
MHDDDDVSISISISISLVLVSNIIMHTNITTEPSGLEPWLVNFAALFG